MNKGFETREIIQLEGPHEVRQPRSTDPVAEPNLFERKLEKDVGWTFWRHLYVELEPEAIGKRSFLSSGTFASLLRRAAANVAPTQLRSVFACHFVSIINRFLRAFFLWFDNSTLLRSSLTCFISVPKQPS